MRPGILCTTAIIAFAAMSSVAQSQISFGAGGGTGVGSRGGSAKGTHGTVFLQLKLPILPGVRADGMIFDVPAGAGRFALTANAVISAPIPVISPYVIAGVGRYGLGKPGAVTGWNAGIGVKVGLLGHGLFVEARRHQKVARDLVTVGLTL